MVPSTSIVIALIAIVVIIVPIGWSLVLLKKVGLAL